VSLTYRAQTNRCVITQSEIAPIIIKPYNAPMGNRLVMSRAGFRSLKWHPHYGWQTYAALVACVVKSPSEQG